MSTSTSIRDALYAVVSDAIDRSGRAARVKDQTSVEGRYVVVHPTDHATPLLLAFAVDPSASPFDDVLRDRARNVAARTQAPYFLITSFRTSVVYSTNAVTKRLPLEDQVVLQMPGTNVISAGEILVAGNRVTITEHLRVLIETVIERDGDHRVSPGDFFVQRTTQILNDLLSCTDASLAQVEAIEGLGTGVIGYTLLQSKSTEDLDPLSLPYSMRQTDLMLDIIGAYLRQARRCGYRMFPDSIDNVVVQTGRHRLFSAVLADLVRLVSEFDLTRLSHSELHDVVDRIIVWCTRTRNTPVPTVDAIDLAIMASGISVDTGTPRRLLEIGSSMGIVGVRARCLSTEIDARVHVTTDAEERQLLLRAIGNIDAGDDLRVLRKDDASTDVPWDIVSISVTSEQERRRLELLLDNLKLTSDATLILFVPLAVLREQSFAGVRKTLAARFDVHWVLTSEVEPLSQPDNGSCCIVATHHSKGARREAARFAFLRTKLTTLIPRPTSVRSFSIERVKQWKVFLRYLSTSEHGKINDEVVVRHVESSTLQSRASHESGWDDLVVPPDVVASILRKLSAQLRPLKSIATVSSGLRTGATEFFAPDVAEISEDSLEDDYWQRELCDGSTKDATFITSHEEVVSIAGLPNSDRRLLLLPEDRKAFAHTNVGSRVERAERDGIHTRATVKKRDPWWHLEDVPIPDLFFAKKHHERWLVAINTTSAIISDAFVGITLKEPAMREQLALWMNSTLGLFVSELVQRDEHVADVTVRDVKEFPIPDDKVLKGIELSLHKELLHRPVSTLQNEYGASDADIIRQSMVARDRRRVDRHLMETVFGLTEEEQRWVYRFALAWQKSSANIRHLANAIVTELEVHHRLQPLPEWLSPRIAQLPSKATKTIVIPDEVVGADDTPAMFSTQVTLREGKSSTSVLQCSSQEEAEFVTILVNLGQRKITVPTDQPIINELLPLVRVFSDDLSKGLKKLMKIVPRDIRPQVKDHVLRSMSS